MNVLILNGSPHSNGTTYKAIHEMEVIFEKSGVEYETVHVGSKDIRGCIACASCFKTGKCVFDDAVNEIAPKFEKADGLVVATPVYYASANATLIALLDRLFFSTHFDKRMKVGAALATARRGGITATFDELNKYFTICGMPVASGQYWNGYHGPSTAEQDRTDLFDQDKEGLQMMRTLAKNMVFLMKSIQLGKEAFGLPEKEDALRTNFCR
ncbi:MAG: flavodoxin family protein [Treponema sp.]|nr:flavodoxin family protein [Treponema sp.]MBD5412632.1 flavodoxin family protein [Treponema sp.]MBD5412945.1 flavodoxin family protein [Treponema sp.]